MKKITTWKPLIKLWDGTPVHGSLDYQTMSAIAVQLREIGFKTEHKAWWSFEDLHNGKVAFVTHTRRLASVYPYTISMRDMQTLKNKMFDGVLPNNIVLRVAAHGHSTAGTLTDETVKMLNLPCWTTFIEYPKALGNFAQFQPDIGAYFIIITETGHVKLQSWLYPTFVFDYNTDTIYSGQKNEVRKYAPIENVVLDKSFVELLNNAKFIVACIADLHIGEVQSIAPPSYTYNGITRQVAQTLANKKLYEYWQSFVKACKLVKPHEIWVVGDVFAGTNVFEKTRRVVTSQLNEQSAMFVELMKEFLS